MNDTYEKIDGLLRQEPRFKEEEAVNSFFIIGWQWNSFLLKGFPITNYPSIIHLGLSCGIQSQEPNTIHI